MFVKVEGLQELDFCLLLFEFDGVKFQGLRLNEVKVFCGKVCAISGFQV